MKTQQEGAAPTRYRDLFVSFLKIGLFTFGGGLAMLPLLQKEALDKHHWVTEAEMLDYYAVSQSLPGIIVVNTALFVGHKVKGKRGGLVAMLGSVVPSFVVIALIAAFLQGFLDNPFVLKAFYGVRVVVAALIVQAILNLWKNAVKNWFGLAVYLAALLLTLVAGLPSWLVVVLAVAAGLLHGAALRRWGKGAGQ